MANKIKKVSVYRIPPGQLGLDENKDAVVDAERFLVNSIEYHPEWHKVFRDIQYDSQGNIEQETVYDYDKQGFLVSEILKEADGMVVEKKTYEPDDKLRIKKEYRHYADGSYDLIDYSYDSSGRVVKKVKSDDEDELEYTVEYEFQNDLLVREVGYDEYGDVSFEVAYVYDDDGLLDEKRIHNIKDGEERVQSYSYNEGGFRDAMLTYDGSGELMERYLFTLDEKGRPVSVVEENRQKKNNTKMEYDEKDNIIFQEEYDLNGLLVSKVRRYYDQDGLLQKSEVTARNPMNGVNQQYEVNHIYEFFDA